MLIKKLLWLFKKIPLVIIGAFAVIGILTSGIIFGLWIADKEVTSNKIADEGELRLENYKLKNVIGGYEELAMLYYRQGENISVVLDPKTLESNPQKIYDTISSLDSFRDQINVQLGKIFQLRKEANLPEKSSESQY